MKKFKLSAVILSILSLGVACNGFACASKEPEEMSTFCEYEPIADLENACNSESDNNLRLLLNKLKNVTSKKLPRTVIDFIFICDSEKNSGPFLDFLSSEVVRLIKEGKITESQYMFEVYNIAVEKVIKKVPYSGFGVIEVPKFSKDKPKDELKDKSIDKPKDKLKDKSIDKPKDELKDKSIDKLKDELKDKPEDKSIDKLKDESKNELKDKPKDELKDESEDEPIVDLENACESENDKTLKFLINELKSVVSSDFPSNVNDFVALSSDEERSGEFISYLYSEFTRLMDEEKIEEAGYMYQVYDIALYNALYK